MTHRDEREWLAYLKDEWTDEQREQAEEHLYGCDICLERWEKALLLANDAALPSLTPLRAELVTDSVMEAVADKPAGRKRSGGSEQACAGVPAGEGGEQKTKFSRNETRPKGRSGDVGRRRAFLHYAIAVCITLVLMSTGLWKAIDADSLPTGERHGQPSGETAQQRAAKGSYTKRMMHHTVDLLEHWTQKAAGSEADSKSERGMGS